MTVADRDADTLIRDRLAKERTLVRQATNDFISAIVSADRRALYASAEAMTMTLCWGRGFSKAAKLTDISPESRRTFLDFWIEEGNSIRCEAPCDLELIRALRTLMPPYGGLGARLFRGESARYRTYGMSWSASRTVAREFAEGHRVGEGGARLLGADVPAEAIICAPHIEGGKYNDEEEYLVDRRRLRHVRMLERLSFVPPGTERI